MNKTQTRRLFQAIENGDEETVLEMLDGRAGAIEAIGAHNNYVRDKTPLMYAIQCNQLHLANVLLYRGANAAAVMTDGPRSSTLFLCVRSAYCDKERHDDWVRLATRLIDGGADPNLGLWPALHGFGGVVDRDDLIRLVLDRGADPDRQLGDSGNTVRELIQINAHLHTRDVLDLFGVEPEVRKESEQSAEPPFLEHPSGVRRKAKAALIEAMQRLDELGEVERWINFSGQGRGQTDESYIIRDVAYRNGVLDLKIDDHELMTVLEATGLATEQVKRDQQGRLILSELTPSERGSFMNTVFLTHFNLKPTLRGKDYAVCVEWS